MSVFELKNTCKTLKTINNTDPTSLESIDFGNLKTFLGIKVEVDGGGRITVTDEIDGSVSPDEYDKRRKGFVSYYKSTGNCPTSTAVIAAVSAKNALSNAASAVKTGAVSAVGAVGTAASTAAMAVRQGASTAASATANLKNPFKSPDELEQIAKDRLKENQKILDDTIKKLDEINSHNKSINAEIASIDKKIYERNLKIEAIEREKANITKQSDAADIADKPRFQAIIDKKNLEISEQKSINNFLKKYREELEKIKIDDDKLEITCSTIKTDDCNSEAYSKDNEKISAIYDIFKYNGADGFDPNMKDLFIIYTKYAKNNTSSSVSTWDTGISALKEVFRKQKTAANLPRKGWMTGKAVVDTTKTAIKATSKPSPFIPELERENELEEEIKQALFTTIDGLLSDEMYDDLLGELKLQGDINKKLEILDKYELDTNKKVKSLNEELAKKISEIRSMDPTKNAGEYKKMKEDIASLTQETTINIPKNLENIKERIKKIFEYIRDQDYTNTTTLDPDDKTSIASEVAELTVLKSRVKGGRPKSKQRRITNRRQSNRNKGTKKKQYKHK